MEKDVIEHHLTYTPAPDRPHRAVTLPGGNSKVKSSNTTCRARDDTLHWRRGEEEERKEEGKKEETKCWRRRGRRRKRRRGRRRERVFTCSGLLG